MPIDVQRARAWRVWSGSATQNGQQPPAVHQAEIGRRPGAATSSMGRCVVVAAGAARQHDHSVAKTRRVGGIVGSLSNTIAIPIEMDAPSCPVSDVATANASEKAITATRDPKSAQPLVVRDWPVGSCNPD